ncbi:MAG: hypothetical protein ACO1OB_05525 [Archangium sp.]
MRIAATSPQKPRVMDLGDTGKRVRQLENTLKAEGLLKGKVDSTFDARTGKAVVAWKKQNNWVNDSPVVGRRLADELGLKGTFKKGEPEGTATPKTLRGASYNCKIHRNPEVVGRTVAQIAKSKNLDFIQLQEISTYRKQLEKIPGYKLITFPGSKDRGETGILVRDSIEAKFPKSIEADVGWTNVRGGVAQPRASTTVRLAGWLRVGSVHAPPGIDWKNGRPVGGEQRIRSYQSLTSKLAAHANRAQDRGLAVLLGGDWNEGAATGGRGSPSWLANKAGLKKYPTGGIDWQMASGLHLTKLRRGAKYGSDHPLVTFTVKAK